MKYRIVKRDALNWQLERYAAGGDIHPITGKATRAGWRKLESYHPSLPQAARALVAVALGEVVLDEGGILEAVRFAHQLQQAQEAAGRAAEEAAKRYAPAGVP